MRRRVITAHSNGGTSVSSSVLLGLALVRVLMGADRFKSCLVKRVRVPPKSANFYDIERVYGKGLFIPSETCAGSKSL